MNNDRTKQATTDRPRAAGGFHETGRLGRLRQRLTDRLASARDASERAELGERLWQLDRAGRRLEALARAGAGPLREDRA